MAYELHADETVADAIVRCSYEQLDTAIAQLSEGVEKDPVAAVHAARKAIKKERSLLRLARGAVRRKQRVAVNETLREVARGLSEVRDADVKVQTLDQLAERFSGQVPAATFSAVREQLGTREHAAQPDTSEAVEGLRAMRAQVDGWDVRGRGWSAIDGGLTRSYRRGRKALRRAAAEPSVENLHAWRKRVKDTWYHLRLLGAVCGPRVAARAEEAHRLSDLLGDDHDLAVLRDALSAGAGDAAAAGDALVALIDHRREQLQTEAISAGRRVYAEKPRAFRRRLRRLWRTGRTQARAERGRRSGALAKATRPPSGI